MNVSTAVDGDFLLFRFKQPVQYLRLEGCRGVPWLEVGDRITVTSDNISAKFGTDPANTTDYYIGRLDWSFMPGQAYRMEIDAVRCYDLFPETNYFKIGTSRYNGEALLFW